MRHSLLVVLLLSSAPAASLGCSKSGDAAPAAGASPSTESSHAAGVTSEAGTGAAPGATVAAVRIIANTKGFTPSKITVKKGEPARLEFFRTTNETCAQEVVFPELHLEKELPLQKPVAIDLPTDEERTFTFQCGMGMYKSSVVIQ